MSVFVFPSLFWELEVQFVTLACIMIMKGSIMLKIKIKVNDVIQAPKNKNASMHV